MANFSNGVVELLCLFSKEVETMQANNRSAEECHCCHTTVKSISMLRADLMNRQDTERTKWFKFLAKMLLFELLYARWVN